MTDTIQAMRNRFQAATLSIYPRAVFRVDEDGRYMDREHQDRWEGFQWGEMSESANPRPCAPPAGQEANPLGYCCDERRTAKHQCHSCPHWSLCAPAVTSTDAVRVPPSIDEMVNRFLGWKLPEGFSPDAGVSFKPISYGNVVNWPVGTNLLSADQARKMILHMLAGGDALVPPFSPSDLAARILALKRRGSSGSDYYGAEDSWNDAIEAAADLVSAAAREEQG